MTALVDVRHVAKRFVIPGSRRATLRDRVLHPFRSEPVRTLSVLTDVSFSVRPGEAVGLMGRNGSGKSTLLRIIAGIYTPDAGAVTVSAPMTPILELGLGWSPALDAVDNVLLFGTTLGYSRRELHAKMAEILAFAELDAFANVQLQHYSSGMAARLAYAVAFAAPREVLVLDEIFAVGDARFKARCATRFRELKARGHTILLVSHEPALVREFCDRGLLLADGRITVDDTPERASRAYLTPPRAAPVERAPGEAPAVSVVIPCYNLGRYLDEAVNSVLAQTFQDVEIIVIDDGSTDADTRRLLTGYARPKTRVIATENRGLAAARNLGVEAARGRYLCALDADDRLEPTYFEKAVRLLDAQPALAFVSSWLRTFGDEEWEWTPERCDLPALLAECTVSTAALVRRSAVLAVGGYDVAMGTQGYEDWDLWISLVERGYTGTILPEVLFHYRRRAGSMSTHCNEGDAHLGLMEYLITKHDESYRRHLFDVLLRREADATALLRTNYRLEREVGG